MTHHEDGHSEFLDDPVSELEALRRELLASEEFRYGYAESHLDAALASQIKALREQRGMTQAELAEAIGTKQSGVSRCENVNHSSWKTDTLWRLAKAFGVRLKISFEDFGSLLDEVDRFSRASLERPVPSDDRRLTRPLSTEGNVVSIHTGCHPRTRLGTSTAPRRVRVSPIAGGVRTDVEPAAHGGWFISDGRKSKGAA